MKRWIGHSSFQCLHAPRSMHGFVHTHGRDFPGQTLLSIPPGLMLKHFSLDLAEFDSLTPDLDLQQLQHANAEQRQWHARPGNRCDRSKAEIRRPPTVPGLLSCRGADLSYKKQTALPSQGVPASRPRHSPWRGADSTERATHEGPCNRTKTQTQLGKASLGWRQVPPKKGPALHAPARPVHVATAWAPTRKGAVM